MRLQTTQAAVNAPLPPMMLDDLLAATTRLTELMREEGALLDVARYRDIAGLHGEKESLLKLLETHQERLQGNALGLQQFEVAKREELLRRTDALAEMAVENGRKLAVARAVNGRIMQAITDVMSDQQRPNTYGKNGLSAPPDRLSLSFSLNERA
jgi:flagellar biosynthesis/type III secretory pathway chaperone